MYYVHSYNVFIINTATLPLAWQASTRSISEFTAKFCHVTERNLFTKGPISCTLQKYLSSVPCGPNFAKHYKTAEILTILKKGENNSDSFSNRKRKKAFVFNFIILNLCGLRVISFCWFSSTCGYEDTFTKIKTEFVWSFAGQRNLSANL